MVLVLLVVLVLPHLDNAVCIQEQLLAAEAAVEAAQGHVEAEGEEVAMVEMAHTVVQPGCILLLSST